MPPRSLYFRAGLRADDDDSRPPPTVARTTTTQEPTRTRSRRQPQRIYTVQSGDTLDEIAHEHGATVEQLLGLNPSIEPTELRPGQRLRVP